MAVKRIPVPFCDCCGEPWLPKHLKDGTINPAFLDPKLLNRCGKCKRTGWNTKGLDRRRKPVEAEPIPEVTQQDVAQTIDMPEVPAEAFAYVERLTQDAQLIAGGARSSRCRHGLYSCPQCQPEKAA